MIRDYRLSVTTDGSGDGTDTIGSVKGILYAVEWLDGGFDDGVDAVLSNTVTPSGVDQTILTLTDANDDDWYFPQELVHDKTGSETAYYTYPVVNGTLQLVVSSGGDTKTGGCIVYVVE